MARSFATASIADVAYKNGIDAETLMVVLVFEPDT